MDQDLQTLAGVPTSQEGDEVRGSTMPPLGSLPPSQQMIEAVIGTPSSSRSKASRKCSPGTTTARKRQKKVTNDVNRIKIGCRVKILRKHLFHILDHDDQRLRLDGFNDNYNIHGTIKSGNTSRGYTVMFDMLPVGHKDVLISRKKLKVIKEGEEEVPYDRRSDDPERFFGDGRNPQPE
jgi:hypothetical protein